MMYTKQLVYVYTIRNNIYPAVFWFWGIIIIESKELQYYFSPTFKKASLVLDSCISNA